MEKIKILLLVIVVIIVGSLYMAIRNCFLLQDCKKNKDIDTIGVEQKIDLEEFIAQISVLKKGMTEEQVELVVGIPTKRNAPSYTSNSGSHYQAEYYFKNQGKVWLLYHYGKLNTASWSSEGSLDFKEIVLAS